MVEDGKTRQMSTPVSYIVSSRCNGGHTVPSMSSMYRCTQYVFLVILTATIIMIQVP